MKITLYVDTDTYNLYREEDFNEILEDEAEQLAKDESMLREYLDDTYTSLELFRLTDEQREDILSNFKDWCLQRAKNFLLEYEVDYVEREIEI